VLAVGVILRRFEKSSAGVCKIFVKTKSWIGYKISVIRKAIRRRTSGRYTFAHKTPQRSKGKRNLHSIQTYQNCAVGKGAVGRFKVR